MELPEGWEPMDTFPTSGDRCDILCEGGVIAKDIHWGRPPVGSGRTFVGSQNILSPWLIETNKLVGWRPRQDDPPISRTPERNDPEPEPGRSGAADSPADAERPAPAEGLREDEFDATG